MLMDLFEQAQAIFWLITYVYRCQSLQKVQLLFAVVKMLYR